MSNVTLFHRPLRGPGLLIILSHRKNFYFNLFRKIFHSFNFIYIIKINKFLHLIPLSCYLSRINIYYFFVFFISSVFFSCCLRKKFISFCFFNKNIIFFINFLFVSRHTLRTNALDDDQDGTKSSNVRSICSTPKHILIPPSALHYTACLHTMHLLHISPHTSSPHVM